MVVVIFGACTAKAPAAGGNNAGGADAGYKLGLPMYTLEHIYWTQWLDRIEERCAELGIEPISADSKYDPAKQMALMEESEDCPA